MSCIDLLMTFDFSIVLCIDSISRYEWPDSIYLRSMVDTCITWTAYNMAAQTNWFLFALHMCHWKTWWKILSQEATWHSQLMPMLFRLHLSFLLSHQTNSIINSWKLFHKLKNCIQLWDIELLRLKCAIVLFHLKCAIVLCSHSTFVLSKAKFTWT